MGKNTKIKKLINIKLKFFVFTLIKVLKFILINFIITINDASMNRFAGIIHLFPRKRLEM